ncbi:MAG: alpha/beta fold hydrolase [Chloroflexi bacterium]|nr:alpha/beta fold hydrolase [Chloroflexota bacterium]
MSYQFADLNGTNIHYELRGEGTAVTFIHAGIANLHMWDDQMEAFAAKHRTLRYDVRGWGETIWNDVPYSDHEDLRALLQHLGIGKTAVVGCSFGGKIALDFSLAYPEMVTVLVLVGSALGGYQWTSAGFAAKEEAMETAFKRGDIPTAAEYEAQIWVDGRHRTPAQIDATVRQHALQMINHTLARPEGSGEKSAITPPALERLNEIQRPVQIIVGEHDWPDIQAIADLLEAKLPLVEDRTIMRQTAHLPNMERPLPFNKIILDFLDKLAWRSTIYAILPHQDEAKVWLEQDESSLALPHITMVGSFWNSNEAKVQRPLRHKLGQNIQVLYRAHFQQNEAAKTTEFVFVLDNVGVEVADGRWLDRRELQTITLTNPDHKRLIETSLQEWETGDVPAERPSWARRGWVAPAESWIETTLSQQGQSLIEPLEIVKNWCLSCVLRTKTDNGVFYFKTVVSLPLFVNEAVVVTKLAQLFPQHVLTPTAIDAERDWMLLPALPQIVNGEATVAQRQGFIGQFAKMQITAVSHIETLLAAGCLDRRMAWMQTQIELLFTAKLCQDDLNPEEIDQLINLIPSLQALCAELADGTVPQTLVHGDLHSGNVGIQNGEFVYIDWTDACLSHPFFDMLDIFYEKDTAVQTQLRDAYLTQWTEFAPMPQLLKIWTLAEVGAAVHHAISYWQIVANLEPQAQDDLQEMIPFWLRKILTLTRNLKEETF